MQQNDGEFVDREYLGDLDVNQLIGQLSESGRSAERTEVERDWRINMAWFAGEPWYRKDIIQGQVSWVAPEHRANRFHINTIFPRVQTLAGNETYIPRFEGRNGASTDMEDMMRVRAAADAANHAVRASEFARAIREAHIVKHICGVAWFKIGVDPNRGPMGPTWGQAPCPVCGGIGAIPSPLDGQAAPCYNCATQGLVMGQPDLPQLDPGNIYDQTGEAPQGEIDVQVIPPWEIISDPDAPSLFKGQWLIHERDLDRDVAWEMFCKGTGIHAKELEVSNFTATLDRLFSATQNNSVRRGTQRKNLVRVRELYKLRSETHPNGVYGCTIGTKTIRAGKLPWTHNKIPYVPLRCHVMPGKLYPRSTVDNLMPIAVGINEHMTNMFQRAQMSVQLRVIAPRGSGVDLTDIPGMVEYDHKPSRPKPEFWQDSGANPDAANMVDRLMQEADNVSFANDVLRGEAAGSDDNARFSAFREQRSINPLKMMIDDNAESLSLVGRLLIDTMKVFYKDGRLLRTFGPHGRSKFMTFKLEQIGDSTDVELLPARDIGRTLASRREEIYEAKKAGVFDDPQLMRLAEFATEESIYDETEQHESCALQENERIRHGQLTPQPGPAQAPGMPPTQVGGIDPPQKRENHQIHNSVHLPFLTELRMTLGPHHEFVQAMLAHMEQHDELAIEEQLQAQQMQMQAAQKLGLANAANPEQQPAESVEMAKQQPTDVMPQGQPGPPESQPSLDQATEASMGNGAANV